MKTFIFCLLSVLAIFILPGRLSAQSGTYIADKQIAIPGDGGYDYLNIDEVNHRLYVSHGTAVDVIDLETEKVIGTIDKMQGVHGIAVANEFNMGFISDGRANAVVAFDLKTLKIIATIPIDGKGPDAIIYDSYSKRVFSFNGASKNASVIDAKELKQIGSVDLGGQPEFAVPDGKGKMYNNLEDKNSLNIIDTRTLKVVQNYSLAPCGAPTGIALDSKNGRVFSVCRENKGLTVTDIKTGKVIATLPIGAGVDAVVYDAEKQLVMASNGDGTASIYKQSSPDKYVLVQTLQTSTRAKTMTLDTKTHKIYFSAYDYDKTTQKVIPGSFKVLVYHLQ